jgi:hypothetical protein
LLETDKNRLVRGQVSTEHECDTSQDRSSQEGDGKILTL